MEYVLIHVMALVMLQVVFGGVCVTSCNCSAHCNNCVLYLMTQ